MSEFFTHNDDYDSGFADGLRVDRLIKLPSGGSTCDIFRARWQRREVFVKRLKEEFRTKPLYLDALDKEFDIGAGLQHPALPRYLEFHRDYIVMDYIDGPSLADMISRRDPWLANEKHVERVLTELVDVVDYLHRHNVVHCDIKPDNIMITSNGKNLVLVDFDKSYTAALNDTSGHPGRYGLTIDDVGKTAIDFRGIAMVAERLRAAGYKFGGYKAFVKACHSAEADCEMIRATIGSSKSKLGFKSVAIYAALAMVAGGLLIGLRGVFSERNEGRHSTDSAATEVNDKGRDNDNTPEDPADTIRKIQPRSAGNNSAPLTREDIHNDAKRMAEQLDKRIVPYFAELQTGLDRLEALQRDTTLSGQQFLNSVRALSDKADEYIAEAFEIVNEMYPGLTDREAWRIMSYSKAYTGYTRRMAICGKAFRQEYERRFALEGTKPQ